MTSGFCGVMVEVKEVLESQAAIFTFPMMLFGLHLCAQPVENQLGPPAFPPVGPWPSVFSSPENLSSWGSLIGWYCSLAPLQGSKKNSVLRISRKTGSWSKRLPPFLPLFLLPVFPPTSPSSAMDVSSLRDSLVQSSPFPGSF